MRGAAILLVLMVLGCGRDRLHGIEGGVRVADSALAFPRTFIGYPSTQTLQLSNTSPAARTVTLSVGEPYAVASTVTVPPASKLGVPVRFTPTTSGQYPSTLTVISEGKSTLVALSGEGADVPVCSTAAPCTESHFDPARGACVTTTESDGTACSGDACLVNATCRAGVCVGEARRCDDGNACTADSCDPVRGCVHTDATASCPAPAEPCKVAACDPSGGCGQTDAPDGTVCGSVSCTQAHVCLMGTCRAVTPPDGFECAPASPCQAHGTCQQGQCAQPPATVLQPQWTARVTENLGVAPEAKALVADERGNLFVLARDTYAARIVSFTSAGFERFDVPAPGTWSGVDDDTMIAEGDALIISGGGVNARVLSPADGRLLAETASDVGGTGLVSLGGTIFGTRQQYASSKMGPVEAFLLDGGRAWSVAPPDGGNTWVAASDGVGTVLIVESAYDNARMQSWIVARTSDGQEKWRWMVDDPYIDFVAPSENLIQTMNGQAYSLDDGRPRPSLGGGNAQFTDGRILFQYFWETSVVARDPSTGQASASWAIPDYQVAGIFVTSKSTALVRAQGALRELQQDGGIPWTCSLPSPVVDDSAFVWFQLLGSQQFFRLGRTPDGGINLEAYALPGIDLADHGWVMAGGNPGRTNHPR